MTREEEKKPGLVPFPRFFAIFGYAVFCLIVILMLGELASRIAFHFYQIHSSPLRHLDPNSAKLLKRRRGAGNFLQSLFANPDLDVASASPAFDGYAWADDFWRDFRTRQAIEDAPPPYEPFRIWGAVPSHSQYFNVDHTAMGDMRRTVNAQQSACGNQVPFKIWVFGGSAVWGLGTPDFATIPSYLSQTLRAQTAKCIEVENFGIIGYVTNNEVISLIQLLKAGWRPDVVVFYDGYNDAYIGAFDPALPATHSDYFDIKEKFESTIISWPDLRARFDLLRIIAGLKKRNRDRHAAPISIQESTARARATMDNYEANLRLITLLAKEYNFTVYSYWQPYLEYGSKPLVPFERVLSDQNLIHDVYEEADRRAAAGGRFVFLGRIFDQVNGPIYLDSVHLGPRGNEIIAGAIASKIQPLLISEKEKPAR